MDTTTVDILAVVAALPGVEVLITKGVISGPEVEKYRARDQYLDKATWIGLLISAVLLLVILVVNHVASIVG
jgi:hypothetical protein